MNRILADMVLLALLYVTPWWFVCLVLLAALIYFNNFLEIIIFGFLLDALYALPYGFFHYIFTCTAGIVFFLSYMSREFVRT